MLVEDIVVDYPEGLLMVMLRPDLWLFLLAEGMGRCADDLGCHLCVVKRSAVVDVVQEGCQSKQCFLIDVCVVCGLLTLSEGRGDLQLQQCGPCLVLLPAGTGFSRSL